LQAIGALATIYFSLFIAYPGVSIVFGSNLIVLAQSLCPLFGGPKYPLLNEQNYPSGGRVAILPEAAGEVQIALG